MRAAWHALPGLGALISSGAPIAPGGPHRDNRRRGALSCPAGERRAGNAQQRITDAAQSAPERTSGSHHLQTAVVLSLNHAAERSPYPSGDRLITCVRFAGQWVS